MFRPFYAFIGYRYTYVKRKNHFISFISLTSVLGIALGVAVLITVLSVMNGFSREIRMQMLNGTPHITVGKIGETVRDPVALIKTLLQDPKVRGATPYISGQSMLSSLESGGVQGVMVRGIDPNQINEVYPLVSRIKQGSLKNLRFGEYGIIIGQTLARGLGLGIGDSISLIAPEAAVSPAGISPRIKRFTVVGIFAIGDFYDSTQVFINLKDADKFFRMHEAVTGIQLKVQNELEAPIIGRDILRSLDSDPSQRFWVTDWTMEFGSLFKALKIQKITMTFILLLIIAVAAFNLVSSLVMMVADKRSDIAILRTLGASRKGIMSIFMAQGSLVGVLGTVLGVLLGLYLSFHVTEWVDYLQRVWDLELVSKEVYLIGGFLPSEVHFIDVISVMVITLIMCFMATLYPAWRASNVEPAEALRYE